MKVLVTGASGLVSEPVCRELLADGPGRRGDAAARYDDRRDGAGRGASTFLRTSNGAMAGHRHRRPLRRHVRLRRRRRGAEPANVEGTGKVIRAAADAGARRVVVTSVGHLRLERRSGEPGREARDEGRLAAGVLPQSKVPPGAGSRRDRHRSLGREVVVACPTLVLGGPTATGAEQRHPRALPARPDAHHVPRRLQRRRGRRRGAGHVLLAERGKPGRRYLLGGENFTWRLLHTLVADLAGVPGPFSEVATTIDVLAGKHGARGLGDRQGTAGNARRGHDDRPLPLVRRPPRPRPRLHVAPRTAGGRRVAVWLLAGEHLPRWVREALRPAPEVRSARRLVPRPV